MRRDQLIFGGRDDFSVQGRSDEQRDLLDVDSVAGHLLKAGSVFAFLARHRRELFRDELFADLFPSGRGRPSVPADVMAGAIVLQALRGLSDADTVDAHLRSAVEGDRGQGFESPQLHQYFWGL